MKACVIKLMKNFFLFSAFFLLTITSFSQPYDPTKINKKAVDIFQKGLQKADAGNYNDAISLFNQSLAIDSKYIHAYLALAGVYAKMKDYKKSTDAAEKAFAIDPEYTAEDKLPYSVNLAWQGRFEEALSDINFMLNKKDLNQQMRSYGEARRKNYEFAVDYAKQHPNGNYVFAPQNVGSGINTSASEYLPSLTIDGKEFIFTRNNGNEDFYSSTKKKDGSWDVAKPLENINTPLNEGAQMISQDGQWLVFTGCNRPDGYGGCDIYFSFLNADGWSQPVNAGGRINSDQWESQPCLSPDKKDLYFASRRPGGFGVSDIYASHLVNGKWSLPQNLGPQINTFGDEQCP